MDQRELVAVVVTADGRRAAVRLQPEPADGVLRRFLHWLRARLTMREG